MHDLAEFIQSFAWPATALAVLFVLRAELRNFMKKLSDKVADAASTSISSLTTKGINIKLAAANARVTALQATQEQAAPKKRRRKQKTEDQPSREEAGEAQKGVV